MCIRDRAGLVAIVPTLVGVILMCILYAVYATDVVATAIAASTLADTLDTMEKLGDSIHAVSDAMTELLGTTALTADQKMDESRLQLKLAAAEARDNVPKLKPREAMAAIRARTDEAMETARRASETARLNAAEAANAAKLAAQGASERAAERAAELLQLEELSAELQARSDEMRAQMLKKPRVIGQRRMLRAYPKLKHGVKRTSLETLRKKLERRESDQDRDSKE